MVELSELHELTELNEPSDMFVLRERNQLIAFYERNLRAFPCGASSNPGLPRRELQALESALLKSLC